MPKLANFINFGNIGKIIFSFIKRVDFSKPVNFGWTGRTTKTYTFANNGLLKIRGWNIGDNRFWINYNTTRLVTGSTGNVIENFPYFTNTFFVKKGETITYRNDGFSSSYANFTIYYES